MRFSSTYGIAGLALALATAWGTGYVSPSIAASEITIQKYGKNGQVIGSDRSGVNGSYKRNSGGADGSSASSVTSGDRYEPREVIVTGFAHEIKTAARKLQMRLLDLYELKQFDLSVGRLSVPRGLSELDAIQKVQRIAPTLIADFNHLYSESVGKSSDTARAIMGWPRSTNQCGGGTIIGMIDGSVDAKHSALKGRKVTAKSFIGNRHDPGSHDHGTAVAAILVGGPDWGGLLPGAKLYAANIFYEKQNGARAASARALIRALNWLVQERVQVINLSIAGPDNKVLRKVVGAAKSRGVVMIAAAGNGGSNAKPAFPGAYDETIAVTALDKKAAVYRAANQGDYIDFAMPGVRVWTAVPGGGKYQDGTSFAAPFVTALAAAEIASGAPKDPAGLRSHLLGSTVDLGAPGKDPVFGNGLIKTPPRCFAIR